MRFVAYWGEGYGLPTVEIHPLEWFSTDCGYTHDNMWQLSSLKTGESIDLTDPSGIHYVMRVE